MEMARIISDEKENIKLYLMFWLFYIPISLIIIQFNPADFTIVMLVGLVEILGYFVLKDFVHKPIKKKKLGKRPIQRIVQDKPPDPAEIPYFDNVFKPDFGKIEYDLD